MYEAEKEALYKCYKRAREKRKHDEIREQQHADSQYHGYNDEKYLRMKKGAMRKRKKG